MKDIIKRLPFVRTMANAVYFTFIAPFRSFPGSRGYWEERYRSGGNSGAGSYRRLAEFKARVLNDFVRENEISTVIEYGCGDGNQLLLVDYPSYVGFDVSQDAIARCAKLFAGDSTKRFRLMGEHADETAELTLSLDVIYHLVEDDVFHAYMERLFDSATRYVIIYSSNTDEQARFQGSHIRHRRFATWVDHHRPEWRLARHIPNEYPYRGDDREGSFADFYIYEKT